MGGLAHWDNSPLVAGAGGKADGQLNMAVGLWRRAQAKGQVGLGEGLGMEVNSPGERVEAWTAMPPGLLSTRISGSSYRMDRGKAMGGARFTGSSPI